MSFLDLRSVKTYTAILSNLEKKENQAKFVVFDEKNKGFVAKSSDKIFKKLNDEQQKYSDGEEIWSERSQKIMITIDNVAQKIGLSGKGAFLHAMQNCGVALNEKQEKELATKGVKLYEDLRKESIILLTKGKTAQKSGLEPITGADVHQGIERANTIINQRYKTMLSEVLAGLSGILCVGP
jgi:hypothetical protein